MERVAATVVRRWQRRHWSTCGPVQTRRRSDPRASSRTLLAREVHDPGIGFVTLTRVQVTPDLQLARVYYTALGDDEGAARQRAGARARDAVPAAPDRPRLRLRRVPELEFFYDESIAGQDRIEQILQELKAEADRPA